MAETLEKGVEDPMKAFLDSTSSFNFSGSLLNPLNKPTQSKEELEEDLFDQFVTGDYPNNNNNNNDSVKKAILSDGRTIELKKKKTEWGSNMISKSDEIFELSKDSNSLINIREMMNRIEIEKKVAKTLHEDQENRHYEPPLLETVFKDKSQKKNQYSLWTEKYRPNSFLDLIGNERTNRYILSWLNHWNKAVYHKEVELKQKNELEDPFDRPNRKILMIHGPPGIGKTSIAHVISKQLKYEVMEINASDERSGIDLENKVRNSLTSITFSGKPVCLIIDEIDGTSEHGMTKILLNILREDRLATNEYLNKKTTTTNNGSKKNKILLRPIITICNNVYSNSIDKLKPYCEIIKLQRPNNRLIKSRLQKIVKIEKLFNINDLYLDSLIISSNGDLRNCLNHLQFNSNSVSDLDSSSSSSSKDTQLNWYLIMDKIFNRTITKSKKEIFNELIQSPSFSSNSTSFDKLITSCFQTYLQTIELNTDLLNPLEINNWLYFYDLISSTTNSDLFNLSNIYSMIVPMKFFQLFNEIQKYQNNKFNSYSFESSQKLNEFYESKRANLEIIDKFKSNIINSNNSKLLINNPTNSLSTFEINYITRIITPGFKSLSNLKPNEKIKLDIIISLIQSYNFQFQTIRDFNSSSNHISVNNQSFTRFSPNIHALVTLTDQSSSSIMKLNTIITYIQDQLNHIRGSTQTEKFTVQIKRKQDVINNSISSNGSSTKKSKNYNSSVEFFKARYNELNSKLNKQSDDSSGTNSNTALVVTTEGGKPVMSSNEYRIWVKYHEGFSNAVKKNIKFSDLFQ